MEALMQLFGDKTVTTSVDVTKIVADDDVCNVSSQTNQY